jgi:hypothetical protein
MGFIVSEVFALLHPEKTIGIGSIDGTHFEVGKTKKPKFISLASLKNEAFFFRDRVFLQTLYRRK